LRLGQLAGEDAGQQDPVVRAVRFGADRGDGELPVPRVQLGGQPRAGHPVPDDDRGHSFSRRTAQTLNSGIREVGSSASLVSALTPGQWNGANTVSGRIVSTTRAGSSATPRRDTTRTGSPSTMDSASARSGCSSTTPR